MFSLFLHLCLAALCSAAPIADDFTTLNSNATQYGTGGGIVGFIVLVLDILVWIEVLKSSRPVSHKLLWSVLVFIFPNKQAPQIVLHSTLSQLKTLLYLAGSVMASYPLPLFHF